MIKLVIYLLILFHSVVFASYKLISNTPTRLGLDNSAITGTARKPGNSITINYAKTIWYYENSSDSSSKMNIIVSKSLLMQV